MAKDQQGTGGGTATHAGTNYQNRVAAWSAVHILAEHDAVPPLDLPAAVTLESLHAETPHAVDDLSVGTSDGGSVLSQAKHTLSLQTTPDSPLGSAVEQFVREYRSGRLNPSKDRLVIATTSLSSAPIKVHLPAFLNRVRSSSSPDQEWTAGNKEENEAAATLRNHIIRAWRDQAGSEPDATDVIAILRLARIQILDVDEAGQGEREAKQLLRTSILADPTATDAAWNTLITATAGYAVNAQRGDRAALQRALTDAGIAIKAARSFQKDIHRLNDHTSSTLQNLLEYARIQASACNISIQRAVAPDLHAAAAGGHLLVLGAPGAGKSGALYELAHVLKTEGADVVAFAVDQIEAASLGTLRTELNLTHELLEVLDAWPGTSPGYIFIDALDAARSEEAVKTLQSLIGKVIGNTGRWRIVASVRKFDLRYNQTLQRLFRGFPPTAVYTDAEFAAIRHVNVPVLSDAEVAQINAQSAALDALVSAANASLKELLRLPFNLRLLAELVDAGLSAADLQPVRTQVELLDRYWRERIIRGDGQGDARELVLRRVTSEMVARRALRVARIAAMGNDAASSGSLDDLLSTHVLAEWTTRSGAAQREFLTFPHHLLFDYAVARMYVPPEPGDLVNLLTAQPDLLIAIRPSVEIHLQRLWHRDQTAFWDLTFRALASPLNEVGKLLAPSVAALHAADIGQTQPLIDCLNDHAKCPTGIAGLQHVMATLLTHANANGSPRPGPWLEFLDSVTALPAAAVANSVRPYVMFLSENATGLGDADRNRLGAIVRRLLNFALSTTPPNWLLAVNAIGAIVKTITTDPAASVTALRACTTEQHLKTLGYRTLSTLARQAGVLVGIDPSFVRQMYVAGFTYREQSDEKTSMGDSQILPMTSNRKQDYDIGLWQLGETFPKFLQAAPREATEALLIVVENYVRTKHKPEREAVPVVLDGVQTGLLPDYSFIWGSSDPRLDKELKMLQDFENYLCSVVDQALVRQLVNDIASRQPPAAIWRILLACGIKNPTVIGIPIRSLAWDHRILTEGDTTSLAGEFIKVIYPMLDEPERRRAEEAIMAIPAKEPENPKAANRFRDRLLGCLDASALVTVEAVARRRELDADAGPPPNPPDPKIEVTQRDFDYNDYLGEQGVPLDDPEHKRMLTIIEPVRQFSNEFLNGTPSVDCIAEILPTLRALSAETSALEALHEELKTQALTDLTRSCEIILRSNAFAWDAETLDFARGIVFRAAADAEPAPNPEHDEHFQESQSWGRTPRIVAAQAAMALAYRDATKAAELGPLIDQLARDPVASVRFQIASRLGHLHKTAPDLMWELFEHLAGHEQNRGVVQGALDALQRCAYLDPPRIAQLALIVINRTPLEGAGAKDVREQCTNIFVSFAVWHEEPVSCAFVERMLAAPAENHEELHRMILDVSAWLKDEKEDIRNRAFTLLQRILDIHVSAIENLEAQLGKSFAAWPEGESKRYGDLLKNADDLALRLYFASGAHSDDKASPLPPDPAFYGKAKPLIKTLASIPYPHTAHYVIETLVYFAPVDPAGVLVLIGDVVKASSRNGYQYEQLAADLIVHNVERYLAEYRPVLRENGDCHTVLMEILDVFVRVGWPKAHQLTYRLNEIYR
jgi:MoxR-like ATPase